MCAMSKRMDRDVGDNCTFTAPSVMGFSLYDQLRTLYQNKEFERKQQHAVLF